ncbi:MAG: phytanoyl-CoA dioxygenase family protein [Actinomycetota bacterium]
MATLTHNLQATLDEVEEQGYSILEGAIDPAFNAELRDTVRGQFSELGIEPKGNRAEGYATKRLYNLVPRAEVFQRLPTYENVLAVAEGLLDRHLILSGTTAMDIGPGERLQGLHADDGFFAIGRPHRPMMVTTIWALTDFTADNGATRIVPGSHREPEHPTAEDESRAIAAEMPAGSVLVMDSQLWHCGGPNSSDDDWRLGLNVQYVRGFFRTQQNQYLSIPHDQVADYPKRLRELLGFELYRGIMGHVDGASPAAAIGADPEASGAYAASSEGNVFGATPADGA